MSDSDDEVVYSSGEASEDGSDDGSEDASESSEASEASEAGEKSAFEFECVQQSMDKRIKRFYNATVYSSMEIKMQCDWGSVIHRDIYLYYKQQHRQLRRLYPKELHDKIELIEHAFVLNKRIRGLKLPSINAFSSSNKRQRVFGEDTTSPINIVEYEYCIKEGKFEIRLYDDNVKLTLETNRQGVTNVLKFEIKGGELGWGMKGIRNIFLFLNDHLFHLESYMLGAMIVKKGLPVDVAKKVNEFLL